MKFQLFGIGHTQNSCEIRRVYFLRGLVPHPSQFTPRE
jgi:hypothetical protein